MDRKESGIVIHIELAPQTFGRLEEIIEKKINPLLEKYPHMEIHIGVRV